MASITKSEGGVWPLMARILPRSYWESEHKAYVNLEVDGLTGLDQLGCPNDTNPWRVTAF